jgi:hypothetical protein
MMFDHTSLKSSAEQGVNPTRESTPQELQSWLNKLAAKVGVVRTWAEKPLDGGRSL